RLIRAEEFAWAKEKARRLGRLGECSFLLERKESVQWKFINVVDLCSITSIFGGSNRKIFSKNFKGGQMTAIFGGSDLDLSQADIQGPVVVDVVSIFGGVKLIVPANWEVKTNISAILGGVEDKRKDPSSFSPEKKLVLTGVCMFGGVEIKSY
ncbi:MAG: DUF4288 domain-containing protein, partial [Cyclobacteriaceae bacterium]